MIPLIVNTADPMAKVRVLTTKDNSTAALKALHAIGVLHVEKSEELKPTDREAIERHRKEVSQLLTDIGEVLAHVPEGHSVSLEEGIEVVYTRPLDQIDSEVRALCSRLRNMRDRATRLEQEVNELTQVITHLGSLGQKVEVRLADLDFSGRYLFSRVFAVPNEAFRVLYDNIERRLLQSTDSHLEDETSLYLIARTEDRETIESAVKSAGGSAVQIPKEDLTVQEFVDAAGSRIRNLEGEAAKLHAEIEKMTGENARQLVLFREALSAEVERLTVLDKASEANYVTLIEGWIPETEVEATISTLSENVGLVFIDTRKPERAEEPPTKMKNMAALKPFEVIVNMFGTPKYREWDPTPITAYSFAIFFGLMLCDVAYAIGIILAARFLIRKFVDDPHSEGYRLFQRVLYVSGGVALVLGLLAGNYLGDVYALLGIETAALVEPVRQMLSDPIDFIVLSIVIGLVHVNLAHLMALIGGVRQRDRGLVINKISLFALQLSIIPIILRWLFSVSLPVSPGTYDILMYVVGGSVVGIIISSFMQRGGLGAIFWIFDMTGILGDVMSYARLAGVGLATFYLAASFNMLAQLFSGLIPGVIGVIIGTAIAVVVMMLGHLINLALSGIGCFVHSLRLCFVEFLSKFYEGGGEEYSPFRLRTRLVSAKAKA